MNKETNKFEAGHPNENRAEVLDLVPFDDSNVWHTIQEWRSELSSGYEAILKNEVESPALARSYARLIADQWRVADQAGELNNAEPCYILELEANSGEFANRVLHELKDTLSDAEWYRYRPCYLLADSRAERVSDNWQHAALAHWIQEGSMEPISFDSLVDRYIELKSQRLALGARSIGNPLVVIANAVFSSLRQDFYNIHYGECYQSFLKNDDLKWGGQGNLEPFSDLEFHWQKATDKPKNTALLKRYLERFDSANVLMPTQAFKLIENVKSLAGSSCLFLIADRGFHSERSVREQTIPFFGQSNRYFLPVNGHALNWYAQLNNGSVFYNQRYGSSALKAAICFQGNSQVDTSGSIQDLLLTCNDAEVRQISNLSLRASEPLTVDQLHTLLEMTHFDYCLLFSQMGALREAIPQLDSGQRLQWVEMFKQVWRRVYLFEGDLEHVLDFSILAIQLGAWSVAKSALELVCKRSPDLVEAQHRLSLVYLHLGDKTDALRAARRAQQLDPRNPIIVETLAHIQSYISLCESMTGYTESYARSGDISLQPLAAHYTEEFLYQYRDPSIAVMTSLPSFETQAAFFDWLDDQHNNARKNVYAVVHKEFGLIGVVSLNTSGRDSFFYFWIGVDYQGQGLGQLAATLLFTMSRHSLGVSRFHTCVFRDNSRSLSALNQLGFKQQSVRAEAPDQDYLFFINSESDVDSKSSESLRSLLLNIGSQIQLEKPAAKKENRHGI